MIPEDRLEAVEKTLRRVVAQVGRLNDAEARAEERAEREADEIDKTALRVWHAILSGPPRGMTRRRRENSGQPPPRDPDKALLESVEDATAWLDWATEHKLRWPHVRAALANHGIVFPSPPSSAASPQGEDGGELPSTT